MGYLYKISRKSSHMSKIAYIYGKKLLASDAIAKAVYTSEYAVKAGIFVDFYASTKITEKIIGQYEVIILSRPDNILAYGIACCAKKSGCFVIVMLDDDLLSAKGLIHEAGWRQKALKNVIKISDLLLVSNLSLKRKYAPYMRKKRVFVGNTAVDKNEFIDLDKKFSHKNDVVKLVYAAGGGHEALFDRYIRQILPKLANKFGNKISLTFMGVHPDTSDLKKIITIEHIPGMPLKEYRQKIQEGNYDIGLAPLDINSFSASKYFNKYLEYSTAGIAGVYTKTEPYTLVIQDGHNGFLVPDNDSQAWFDKLCLAIENKELREKCVKNAFCHITDNYGSDAVFGKMIKEIPEFLSYTAQRKKVPSLHKYKIIYRFHRILDTIFLIRINWRDGGIKQVYQKVKLHFSLIFTNR